MSEKLNQNKNAKTTYEKILETAYDCFATLGYEQTSLSMIAKNIGISKPALYYHFESKEALFETLYVFIVEEMVSEYVVHGQVENKEALVKVIIDKGLSDIRFLKEKPAFTAILKQYLLLGMRNKKIERLTKRLEESINNYYASLMIQAVNLEIIHQNEIEAYTELLLLLDHGILDKAERLDVHALNQVWTLYINKLFS